MTTRDVTLRASMRAASRERGGPRWAYSLDERTGAGSTHHGEALRVIAEERRK